MAARRTRREFLKSGAAAAAGLVAAPAVATAANKGEKLRMAVIGAGGRGGAGMHAALREHLVAVADVDPRGRAGKNIQNAKKRFSELQVYSDFRELFDKHPKLDAVWVATPDHTHFPAAIRALAARVPVYCEKPLTHDIWEARRLREAAAAQKVPTQMGNQGHSGESIRRIVEYIRAGVLGTITRLDCVSNRSFGARNRPPSKPVPEGLDWEAWVGPAPWRDYHDGLHPFAWRGWLDFGTGSIGDMGCHTIDGAVWALRLYESKMVGVVAKQGGVTQEGYKGKAQIEFRFPERGDLPAVTMTWWNGGGDMKPPRPEQLTPGTK
ncbi:MAG: Gfo/Idh/MocA family protein [Candidatus Brocadiia bacterium]